MVRKDPKEAEGEGVLEGLIDSEILRHRQPVAKPPFTIGDIRRAIPARCFKHSLLRSFGYLFLDLFIVFSLMFLAKCADSQLTNEVFGVRGGPILRSAMWCGYWIMNGCVMTGLWVIGHECGHGGFSAHETVNNVVGIVIHSLLLVPFFSWKISHRRHHSNTGNVDRDEVFVPVVKDAFHPDEVEDDTPLKAARSSILRMINIAIMLFLGWPIYLWVNATGHKSYPKERWVNHFHPSSPIFTTDKERMQVLYSDIGLLVAISIFSYLSYQYGLGWFVYLYFLPYLVVNLFLVLITFLQHTDYTLPHYTTHDWDWLKGALATVDRDFGILNIVFHRITDTHVVHHLFSSMPFYHAKEATDAVKPLLGKYYRFDNTHWIKALWNNFPCDIVRPDSPKTSILWFHHPTKPKNKSTSKKTKPTKQVD